jgi:hypothetical protein
MRVVLHQPPPAFSISQWIERATATAIARTTNSCHIHQLIILNHLRIPMQSLPKHSIVSIEQRNELVSTLRQNTRTSKVCSAAEKARRSGVIHVEI